MRYEYQPKNLWWYQDKTNMTPREKAEKLIGRTTIYTKIESGWGEWPQHAMAVAVCDEVLGVLNNNEQSEYWQSVRAEILKRLASDEFKQSLMDALKSIK